jgi:hypothetical protein
LKIIADVLAEHEGEGRSGIAAYKLLLPRAASCVPSDCSGVKGRGRIPTRKDDAADVELERDSDY